MEGLLKSFPKHLFAQWGLWQALQGLKKINEADEACKQMYKLADESEKTRTLLERYNVYLTHVNSIVDSYDGTFTNGVPKSSSHHQPPGAALSAAKTT